MNKELKSLRSSHIGKYGSVMIDVCITQVIWWQSSRKNSKNKHDGYLGYLCCGHRQRKHELFFINLFGTLSIDDCIINLVTADKELRRKVTVVSSAS